ncbi:carbohydrate ABC transporter permease [Erysipelothrix anatis]|uniref:carbohydrate ABC transporter permease n=1 Tax=Erysipelothrix anatis TaxID=2683713 RepID=UPI00135B41F3|nr:sugar ABC transporter permease [Erysipelothrix anatis]
MKQIKKIQNYIFIMPWVVGFLFLTLIPLTFSLIASFTNYDVTSQFTFVGFENYSVMFNEDVLFWTSLKNTIYYVIISVPITTVLTIFIAYLLRNDFFGIRLFRTVYFLPSVLSGVGVYILWMQLLDPSTGIVNVVLSYLGIQGPNWLTDPGWTKNSLIFMKTWSVGGGMLMYIASMQSIGKSLYEFADLEGASKLTKFFKITLPMITPIILFDVVTSIIGGFQIFQEAYVMSTNGGGGPANSLLFYNLHMWNKAFKSYEMGYAMGMSWVLFLIVLILTMVALKISKHYVHYEGDSQ